jgi:hypothetical protein
MRFGGSVALRCVKSAERIPLERATANKWDSQLAPSARGGRPGSILLAVVRTGR